MIKRILAIFLCFVLPLSFASCKSIATSGSDCHEYNSVGRGGIMTEILPKDNAELCDILRNGKFEPIHNYDFNYDKEFLGK